MTSLNDLRGKKALVFGGAGFVGSQLVRNLLDKKATVAVYDNFLHGHRENLDEIKDDIQIVVGDVLDEWRLCTIFREYKPEYVFNLVGDTYVPTAYDVPKRMLHVNAEGNLNVLMACKQFGVNRVLYVSSTEVYGNARTDKIREDHPLDPWNTYAATKLCADRLCFTLRKEHDIPVIIARIFNCYGPRETEPYVIPDIISQFAKRDYVELGNVKAKRDFTYVKDLCDGLTAVMESEIPNGEAVNVGSGFTISVEEIASRIASIMNKPADIRVDPKRLRRYDIDLFCCDNGKLKQNTDWEPRIDIDSGLKMTVEWYMTHNKRWLWENWIDGAIVGGDSRRL
jgi:nucleoside-diphosphate-sugar epimerase